MISEDITEPYDSVNKIGTTFSMLVKKLFLTKETVYFDWRNTNSK